jgi:hypothetical protein
VPAVIPERCAERGRVLLEFAGIVPDVAPRPSQAALSVADHDTETLVLFLRVTEELVADVPKSTCSGFTSNASVGAGTVIVTDTTAEPDALANVTLVEYVPAARLPRWTDIETVRLERAAIDPDVAPSESQPAFSLAVHERDFGREFVSVTEAVVPVDPKLTLRGETWNELPPTLPARSSGSFSRGEVELQAMAAYKMAKAA